VAISSFKIVITVKYRCAIMIHGGHDFTTQVKALADVIWWAGYAQPWLVNLATVGGRPHNVTPLSQLCGSASYIQHRRSWKNCMEAHIHCEQELHFTCNT